MSKAMTIVRRCPNVLTSRPRGAPTFRNGIDLLCQPHEHTPLTTQKLSFHQYRYFYYGIYSASHSFVLMCRIVRPIALIRCSIHVGHQQATIMRVLQVVRRIHRVIINVAMVRLIMYAYTVVANRRKRVGGMASFYSIDVLMVLIPGRFQYPCPHRATPAVKRSNKRISYIILPIGRIHALMRRSTPITYPSLNASRVHNSRVRDLSIYSTRSVQITCTSLSDRYIKYRRPLPIIRRNMIRTIIEVNVVRILVIIKQRRNRGMSLMFSHFIKVIRKGTMCLRFFMFHFCNLSNDRPFNFTYNFPNFIRRILYFLLLFVKGGLFNNSRHLRFTYPRIR